ncbi:hypothetical protein [Flavobacterium sp.]|uniref:endonuclease/exonuclease/phosphatase family protein n=1 Tax=Flavobacterium sp. TaxID=239 RepID=UPI0031D3095C
MNRKIIDSLQQINPNAKVLTMGDLNDGPFNKSYKNCIGNKRQKKRTFLNLAFIILLKKWLNKGMGTLAL